MNSPAIEFDAVFRRLGGRDVLAGVDLCVAPGETVALVGDGGAGKSTLIRALLDLHAIDRGRIRLGGRAHTERRARERLAYLPERFQPPYYLHGHGFIEYMLALYGVRRADAPVGTTCARLGLDDELLGRSVRTYPPDTGQLLGLAACLLSRRPLLVLDDPMRALDADARLRLREALAGYRAAGATTLLTSRAVADAGALADRVAILHQGRIVADASPAELPARLGTHDLESAFAAAVAERGRAVGRTRLRERPAPSAERHEAAGPKGEGRRAKGEGRRAKGEGPRAEGPEGGGRGTEGPGKGPRGKGPGRDVGAFRPQADARVGANERPARVRFAKTPPRPTGRGSQGKGPGIKGPQHGPRQPSRGPRPLPRPRPSALSLGPGPSTPRSPAPGSCA
ncbi:MAG: ABC transporter ATP-binding protein [Halofilum sp. (in: g-proteobacteria)]|nr:ABC transporter ATP-binding protein [Halofilum sp. (in: g-proteobacteria)]